MTIRARKKNAPAVVWAVREDFDPGRAIELRTPYHATETAGSTEEAPLHDVHHPNHKGGSPQWYEDWAAEGVCTEVILVAFRRQFGMLQILHGLDAWAAARPGQKLRYEVADKDPLVEIAQVAERSLQRRLQPAALAVLVAQICRAHERKFPDSPKHGGLRTPGAQGSSSDESQLAPISFEEFQARGRSTPRRSDDPASITAVKFCGNKLRLGASMVCLYRRIGEQWLTRIEHDDDGYAPVLRALDCRRIDLKRAAYLIDNEQELKGVMKDDAGMAVKRKVEKEEAVAFGRRPKPQRVPEYLEDLRRFIHRNFPTADDLTDEYIGAVDAMLEQEPAPKEAHTNDSPENQRPAPAQEPSCS